jgi:PAS domain S-box-containing protein
MADELDDADLEWLNEIRELELVDKLQLLDPFKDIAYDLTTNLPRIPIHHSPSASQVQCNEMAEFIENVPYPIFAIDHGGIVIAWNKAIAALTGIEPREMIGKGDYEYACPFYGEKKPMLIDYIIKPDTLAHGELQSITREGDTFIGALENVTIQGTPMLIWGKGMGIYAEDGGVIAAIQSILYSEQQPNINTIISTFEEEHYLGGLSSITIKVPGDGIAGAIAGALGAATGGYGIYATDQRIFVIHNPELDPTQTKGMQFGEFIINELFGTTADMIPRSIEELEDIRVLEVARKDIVIIEMKKPLLFAGYITFRMWSGEAFRVYSDQKMAYFHLEQLLMLHYPDILRID